MTLLEILVKELPGKGGWPKGANYLAQDSDWSIYGFEKEPTLEYGHEWLDGTDGGFRLNVGLLPEASDKSTSIINREQYKAALAERKKVAWDGEGLPPVGCECEIKRVADWMQVTIQYVSCSFTVFKTLGGTEDCYQTHSLQFRPLRSEEERKRDKAIKQLARVMAEPDTHNASIVYQAIAAGKIPHVKIV